MIISLSGTGGSGKSTIAKMLAEKLNFKHYSMGDLQREVAKERGITIAELGELEKTDPSIDKMIDDKQVQLGKNQNNFVIDAWLAPKFIPHAIKIFFDADIKERARRIKESRGDKEFSNIQETIEITKQREKTNRERWIKFYNYDYLDKKNFDFIVNTTSLNIDEVFSEVYDFILTKTIQ